MSTHQLTGLAAKFARFCGVGAVATGLQFAILIAGVRLFGLDAVIASSAGYAAGAVASYLMNYGFTYRSSRPHQEAIPRFVIVLGVGAVLTALLMRIQVHTFGFNYVAAQVLTTGIVLFWHFVAHLRWSFRT